MLPDAVGGLVARFDVTTTLLRPAPTGPTGDLWDDVLRLARRVEYDTTKTFVRRTVHWLVPMLLTGLVAAAGLAQPGLWTDELATWGMAGTTWHEFWPVLRYVDAVLAPYYAFMHLPLLGHDLRGSGACRTTGL